MFSEKELAYILSQPLARLATVAPDLQPDVAAVGITLEAGFIYVTGRRLTRSRKYQNVLNGSPKVALIVDDLESVDPWRARGIRIYGLAEAVQKDGRQMLRITPQVSWSWNLEGPAFVDGKFVTHKVIHPAP